MKKLFTLFVLSVILIQLTTNAQDWKWQNPTPQGNTILTSKFLNANIGYAAGDNGLLLKTITGGNTWITQNSGTVNPLMSICFLDENTGFAASLGGEIIKTTDGGTHWIQQSSANEMPLNAIGFFNASTGIAVGAMGNILNSSDSGQTWTKGNMMGEFNLNAIAIIDTVIAYIACDSGKILKTINRGQTWNSYFTGINEILTSISFIDKNMGWAVSSFGSILKTIDGGQNWSKIGSTTPLYSVQFINSSVGYVAGFWGKLIKTTNGGATWDTINTGTKLPLYSINFINANVGFIMGKFGISLKTIDGGTSLTLLTKGIYVDLLSVDAVDINTAFTVGFGGTILKTSDGGKNWISKNSGTTNALYSIDMFDASSGYAVGYPGMVLFTSNGGETWTSQISNTTKTLFSVYFIDKDNAIAVGDSGAIIKKSGNEWLIINSNTIEALNSVFFINTTTGWAVGNQGTILKTDDGGYTWTSQDAMTDFNLKSVYFIDDQTGYAVGSNGICVKTMDGGNYWMINPLYMFNGTIQSIFYSNQNIGYFVGDGGAILKSNMGGYNWQAQYSGTNNLLFSVSFLKNSNIGYAVGDGGVILKTTTGGCGVPTIIKQPKKQLVCGEKDVQFSVNAIGPNLKYQWLKGDLFLTNDTLPVLTIKNATNYNNGYYSCMISNPCGMVRSDSALLDVVFLYTHFYQTVDSNKAVFTTMGTKGRPYKYFWDFDNGEFSNLENPDTVFYKKQGIYHVCLTQSDSASGCQFQTCNPITIGKLNCNSYFYYSPNVDNNKQINFMDGSYEGTPIYFWDFGDGSTSTLSSPEHIFPAFGYYRVKLTTFNIDSTCTDTYSQVVQVGDTIKDCKADFSFNVDLPTHQVSFANQSVGTGIDQFIWDFGDRDTSTIENPIHTYKNGNFYNVCFSILSPQCQSLICKPVKAGADTVYCSARFDFQADSTRKTVKFFDKSIGNPTTWIWNFGDNKSSTSQNPKNTYSSSGLYMVHLEIKNSKNGCVSHINRLVNVSLGKLILRCRFGYIIDTSFLSKGVFPVEFKGATYGDADAVSWDFGDGDTNSTSLTPYHEFNDTGTYNVCMTVSDPTLNLSDTYCNNVKITDENTVGLKDPLKQYLTLSSYPNPFVNQTTIEFTLPEKSTIDLSVYDITGNKVADIFHSDIDKGRYNFIWNGSGLSNGVYYLQMKTEQGTKTNKIIILK